MSTRSKTALLGATGFAQTTSDVEIHCFPWNRIGSIANLRDYDVVIIDLLSIKIEEVDWETFERVLNIFVMSEILEHGGIIIVVGDPRFNLPLPEVPSARPGSQQLDEASTDKPFLAWTCATFIWDNRPGDTILFDDDYKHKQYAQYVKHLKRWKYSLARTTLDRAALGRLYNLEAVREAGGAFRLAVDSFCRNRYRNALAVECHIEHTIRSQFVSDWGPIVLLPEIELPESETLALVLRDLCGIESHVPEPDWVSEIKAPGQETVDAEITELGRIMEQTRRGFEEARRRRDEIRRPLRLLYDRGLSLEEEIRAVLRRLGADVEDPADPGKEDGWLTVEMDGEIFEGVLEVTGTRNNEFGEDKIRQLMEWKHRGIQLRRKQYKGVFVGVNAIDQPVESRPQGFSASWKTTANLSEVVAVKGEDLYRLLVLAESDPTRARDILPQFWRDLFSSSGVLDCSSYGLRPVAEERGEPEGTND